MSADFVKILVVEDDPLNRSLVQLMLAKAEPETFRLTFADRLAQALLELAQQVFDVILLDLSLPDSNGYDTFVDVYNQSPDVPIVVHTAIDDEALAIQAVGHGAQDYLIKGEVSSSALARALRYAIERHRTVVKLQHLSLLDDLTGLLNRRGFFTVSRQHIKLARRTGRELALFFADLDGLKRINDRFGHQEGDQAIRTCAALLKATFRSSDVVARLGGDEFTILAVESGGDARCLLERMQLNLDQHHQQERRYIISLSIGLAHFQPTSNLSLEELLARADEDLYLHKRAKIIAAGEQPTVYP